MNNKFIRIPVIMTALISLVACSDPNYTELAGVKQLRTADGLSHNVSTNELYSPAYKEFESKMRNFSAKLSEVIAKREYSTTSNYAMSPLSIELCLGLAIRSANGKTRQELLDALDMDYDSFNANYKIFYNYHERDVYNNMDKLTASLNLTNSIWVDDEASLKEDCLDALKNDYFCNSFYADFNKHNKEANQAIRDFNKEKTKGLIDQDLQLSPMTLFVLMNTLYLKDIWNEDGHDLTYAPSTYTFKNANQTVSKNSLLKGYYSYGKTIETNDFSSFYTSTHSGYRIYFIKANEGKKITNVFNKDNINYVLDNDNYVYQDKEKLERYYTNCIFPEYQASSNIDLEEVFKNDFNVETLFNASCDMSNLSDDSVYCDAFKHIAKLKVDKSGIEGAAVTYMAYAGAAGPDEYKDVYETFVVDQEFGFVLTYGRNIVFSGIVSNID